MYIETQFQDELVSLSAMSSPDSELKEQIRSCVENFADTVREEQDFVPKLRIAAGDRGDRKEKIINEPSRIITFYSSRQQEFFNETAEWIRETGNGFDLKEPADPDDEDVFFLGEPEDHVSSDERILLSYVNALFNFAGTVMDYSGGYVVTDDGFNQAYEEHWLPKYETGLKTFEIIIPLHLFTIPRDDEVVIELSPEFELREKRHNYYRVESLRICPITDSERRGVHTSSAGGGEGFSLNPIDACKFKIYAEIAAREPEATLYDPGEEIGKRLATALRLFNPDSDAGDLTIGTTFRREPSWLEFREGIPDFIVTGDANKDRTQRQEGYLLYPDSVEEFAEFWERHCKRIRLDRDGRFTRSIQRFNEIWSKRFFEDQLLDCLIGLEGLLLQGVGSGSSITFRLKLRGGQILNNRLPYDRDYIQKFLRDIYSLRGDIVHENEYLADVLDQSKQLKMLDEEFEHPKEVVAEARSFMGVSIVAYMDLAEETGMSIDKLGEKMDKAALDADSTDVFESS